MYLNYRTNATPEEKKNAILEDSNAFGIASFTIGLIEFLCLTIAMDLGNYSALRQVKKLSTPNFGYH